MKLTARQAEVCALIAQGLGDKQIAARLRIGTHGVRRHVEKLFRRFDQRSRVGLAIAFAQAWGGKIASGRNATCPRRKKRAKVRA